MDTAKRIRFLVGEDEIVVRLEDNPAAESLYEMLPMELNFEDYNNTEKIAYPIWWGQAPKIIYTFLESYDFSGKTIIPFCTSASSGIGGSISGIQALAPNANWLSGQRFSGSASLADVKTWTDGLDFAK